MRIAQRKEALAPLKAALKREGRSQVWLRSQLTDRVRIEINMPLWKAYMGGYTRMPGSVLSAACWIAGVREADILARIDEVVLLQPKRANKRNAANA